MGNEIASMGKWQNSPMLVKFISSEKTTKFCEISTLNLTTVHTVKSKGEISQNFVAFSEDMNFKKNENQANRIENPSAVWIDFCDLDTIFRYGH